MKDELYDTLELCERLIDNHKSDEALVFLNEAINNYPASPEAYDLRAVAQIQLLNATSAVDDFNKALELDKQFHLSHWHLAELYITQKDFTKAEQHCLAAIAIIPDNYFYSSTHAYIKLHQKRYNECIDICNKKLNFYPVDTYFLNLRAGCFMELKQYYKAVDDYETIYQNSTEDAEILNGLGYAYSKTGNIERAKHFLFRAIKLMPGFSYPYDNLGYVFMLENEYAKAHEYIDKSIELDPTNSYAFKNKALVYLAQRNVSKAVDALLKAKALQFELYYGDEVNELLAKYNFTNK